MWSIQVSSVLVRTISVGGDTDTIASIAGQPVGTVSGLAGIPPDLLVKIDDRGR
jgi:ADP-ribosylglycohydrolase